MPLKKYNTSSILIPSLSTKTNNNSFAQLSSSSLTKIPTKSTSVSPPPPLENQKSKLMLNTSTSVNNNLAILNTNINSNGNMTTNLTIANQMSSLTELLPNILESAVSSVLASSGSASDTISNGNASVSTTATPVVTINAASAFKSSSVALPTEIKSRLFNIFNQIEHEFDLLYAENVRLQQQLLSLTGSSNAEDFTTKTKFHSPDRKSVQLNSNSTSRSTLIAANTSGSYSPKSPVSTNNSGQAFSPTTVNSNNCNATSSLTTTNIGSGNNQIQQLQQHPALTQSNSFTTNAVNVLTTTSSSAKTAILSSKTRINNLSFPKFRPNAREFIMQSIKNTSAQIVNKTQNNNSGYNSKHQYTLTGHKDGIWDINCIPIPNHLLFNSSYYQQQNASNSLLIGTASADSTARLWYLNSQYGSFPNSSSLSNNMYPLSPLQNQIFQFGSSSTTNGASASVPNSSTSPNTQIFTSGFCVQQYCGHSGSVNSIRFHPRFFSEATNLILTASGDCQAHIWQCVLSPVNDSLESTSECVLNYNNCYSFAMNTINQYNINYLNNNNSVSSPPSSSLQSPANLNTSNTNNNSMSSSSNNNNNNITNNGNSINNNNLALNNFQYHELISNAPIIRSPIKRFEGHSDVCIAAEWFPDGEQLATASWDRSANVYNVETGKTLCNLQHDDYLTNVSIHKTHKIILTSSKDTTFKVWDFRDPICSVNVYQGHSRSVNSAIFINDDKIATSSDDQTVKLWDLRIMRSPVCTISVNSGVNRICTINAPTANSNIFEFNSMTSGETFLCLPLDNRDIKIYNLQGERIMRLPRTSRIGHRRLVTSVASHGNMLLSSSFDKLINCWSFEYNPPKSSSSGKFTSVAQLNNNKENNEFNGTSVSNATTPQAQQVTNESIAATFTTSSSSHKIFESRLFTSVSASPPATQTSSSFFSSNASNILPSPNSQSQQQQQQPPLTLITNSSASTNSSNSKGIATLTKLAERIKI